MFNSEADEDEDDDSGSDYDELDEANADDADVDGGYGTTTAHPDSVVAVQTEQTAQVASCVFTIAPALHVAS